MSGVREARVRANLSTAELGNAVGRTATWICAAETGVTPLDSNEEKILLEAIARLERFAASVATAREKLTADLHLPPPRFSGREKRTAHPA